MAIGGAILCFWAGGPAGMQGQGGIGQYHAGPVIQIRPARGADGRDGTICRVDSAAPKPAYAGHAGTPRRS